MRGLARFLSAIVMLTSPAQVSLGFAAQLARVAFANADQSILRPLKFDTANPAFVTIDPYKPNFTVESAIPARQAWLASQSHEIKQMLKQNGLKTDFAEQYLAAQLATGTPWELIAAVHKVESNQRGDTSVASYAGAQGPMQFMPGTWRAYARDADGDGIANINDVEDAILTGATYLKTNGADRGNYQNALFRYNHSTAYVNYVLGIATRLGL